MLVHISSVDYIYLTEIRGKRGLKLEVEVEVEF